METTQTLEKVLADIEAEGFGDDPRVKKLVGRGFRAGLTRNIEQADPLAGYSNLTAAITAKDPIDWEQLNGRKTQCVNLDIGTVTGQLKRAPEWEADKLYGWRDNRLDHVYTIALNQAWEGKDGWALWVEGEIPLVQNRQELEELEVQPLESVGVNNIPTDPLAGYSNLTAAIEDDEPIDWEKLDGLKVQCVHPELRGEIHGALKRNAEANAELSGGWRDRDMDEIYTSALWAGWHGKRGWTLWIEGDIPLIRKTADQLEEYTYFQGNPPGEMPGLAYVADGAEKQVLFAPSMRPSHTPASMWEVLEEYGTFQKPERK